MASVLPDSETFCRVANAWVAQLLRREIARAGRAGLLHDSPLEDAAATLQAEADDPAARPDPPDESAAWK